MGGPRDEAWDRLRRAAADRESGAADIARRAAATLVSLPRTDVVEAVRALVRGHPSMAPVWRLGLEVLEAGDHVAAAGSYAARLAREREAVAARAAGLLSGEVVTLSYSSTLVAAVASAGTPALCARSEPGGEGTETARLLVERGVAARVVDDEEAAVAAANGRTVVVGADAVGPGGVVNKVGTGKLARAAGGGGAPAYAVAGDSKFLAADLPVDALFERVPLEAFTAIVTDGGPLRPEDAADRARRYPVPDTLRDLIG